MMKCALLVTLLLLFPALAHAQAVACIPSSTPQGVVFGRSLLTFQSADHTAVDPAGQLKVQDYFAEVRRKADATVITNFTVPKPSVTPITGPGVPAGCLQTLLPAMQGLLPSDTYTLFFYARNVSAVRSDPPITTDFFLSQASVPTSPASLLIVTP